MADPPVADLPVADLPVADLPVADLPAADLLAADPLGARLPEPLVAPPPHQQGFPASRTDLLLAQPVLQPHLLDFRELPPGPRDSG